MFVVVLFHLAVVMVVSLDAFLMGMGVIVSHTPSPLARAARLAINPAIAPAPIPFPTFTTAMPGAHVCSIEYSAATP
jgi:hypothetical protein